MNSGISGMKGITPPPRRCSWTKSWYDSRINGQKTIVESLKYAYLSNTKKSPSVEGKIAELIDDMLIGGPSFDTVKETEWSLNWRVFEDISDTWGPFQIDLFTSRLNIRFLTTSHGSQNLRKLFTWIGLTFATRPQKILQFNKAMG